MHELHFTRHNHKSSKIVSLAHPGCIANESDAKNTLQKFFGFYECLDEERSEFEFKRAHACKDETYLLKFAIFYFKDIFGTPILFDFFYY